MLLGFAALTWRLWESQAIMIKSRIVLIYSKHLLLIHWISFASSYWKIVFNRTQKSPQQNSNPSTPSNLQQTQSIYEIKTNLSQVHNIQMHTKAKIHQFLMLPRPTFISRTSCQHSKAADQTTQHCWFNIIVFAQDFFVLVPQPNLGWFLSVICTWRHQKDDYANYDQFASNFDKAFRPYNVSLHQIWRCLDQWKQSYGPKNLENFLLRYMGNRLCPPTRLQYECI